MMNSKLTIAIIAVFILSLCSKVYAVKFEELDKEPEGAHYGQMFLGFFFGMGSPMGSILNAEENFLRGSTYTFMNNGITKTIPISHLHFSYGLLFEYMPINYLGIKVKVKRTSLIQRTSFGSQYKNWSTELYNDFSFYIGPSIHTTKRKRWDITLTPMVGYTVANFAATPVAMKVLNSVNYNIASGNYTVQMYSGSRRRQVNNFTCGAELNLTFYFTGGFFFSIGAEYNLNMLNFDSSFFLQNPQTTLYYSGGNSLVHIIGGILSIGYAFSN